MKKDKDKRTQNTPAADDGKTRESALVAAVHDSEEEFTVKSEKKSEKVQRTGTTPTLISGVLKSVIYITCVIVVSVFAAIGIIVSILNQVLS
ncbi:MAG: hypothetical protein UHG68_03940, partial [Clostridia bacterium]|nr:hypothetical protein [Clostridia bacterium]